MRQITDKRPIAYIVDDDRQEYQVIRVRRPSQHRPTLSPFAPFYLGLVVVVLACFVVTDVDWLIRRAAAALFVLLLVGVGGSIILAFRDLFVTRWWEE